MSETTFENVKVGDNVWDIIFGWGVVESQYYKNIFSVRFGVEYGSYLYRDTGAIDSKFQLKQRLFWNELKIDKIPERPKGMINKKAIIYADEIDFIAPDRRKFYLKKTKIYL